MIKALHEEIFSLAKDSPTYRRIPITHYNIKRFKSEIYEFFIIRKMIRRFLRKGDINEKLLLNNIITCTNIFGILSTNRILRLIMDDEEFGIAKSFLLFLRSFNLPHDETETNTIIDAVLRDIKQRYHLQD